jgi:hypothetical protein
VGRDDEDGAAPQPELLSRLQGEVQTYPDVDVARA